MLDLNEMVAEWWTTHAQNPDRIPVGGIFDATDPSGAPIATPTDHRMLWHLRDSLLCAKKTPHITAVYELLCDYLNANCQHHWRYYECCIGNPECPYPPHWQCLWCHSVVSA